MTLRDFFIRDDPLLYNWDIEDRNKRLHMYNKWSYLDPYYLVRTHKNKNPKKPFKINWCIDIVRDAPESWGISCLSLIPKYNDEGGKNEEYDEYRYYPHIFELINKEEGYYNQYGEIMLFFDDRGIYPCYGYFIPFETMHFLINDYNDINSREDLISYFDKYHYPIVVKYGKVDDYVKMIYRAPMYAISVYDGKYKKNEDRNKCKCLYFVNKYLPPINSNEINIIHK